MHRKLLKYIIKFCIILTFGNKDAIIKIYFLLLIDQFKVPFFITTKAKVHLEPPVTSSLNGTLMFGERTSQGNQYWIDFTSMLLRIAF